MDQFAHSNNQPNVTIEEIAKEFFNNPSYKANSTNTNGLQEFANEFLSANTQSNQNSTKKGTSSSAKSSQKQQAEFKCDRRICK